LTFKPVVDEPAINKPAISKSATPTAQTPPPIATPVQQTHNDNDWASIIEKLNLKGMTKELASNCALEHMDDKVCRLLVDASILKTATAEDSLLRALQAYRGTPLKLEFNSQKMAFDTPALQRLKSREDKQQAAVDNINADSTVQALKTQFDARILPDSIEPL
jgi:DNA polymerase-3 subunit gamma/tau